ncbi:Hypothetical protein CINCED_3A010211 [Cinara cedri]|uniref:Uncharacterized protein n=1 Tax=Cinara cedri TaxID=506608 RepID=A0A5E4NQT6_9HEMI|nr:Hypothetical protein CINCED_3A010211 [Cinara cedri]
MEDVKRQIALESIQVLSNNNKNNEVIREVEKEDDEDQIFEKETKTRQTSINQNRKEPLSNLKIKATKKPRKCPKNDFSKEILGSQN